PALIQVVALIEMVPPLTAWIVPSLVRPGPTPVTPAPTKVRPAPALSPETVAPVATTTAVLPLLPMVPADPCTRMPALMVRVPPAGPVIWADAEWAGFRFRFTVPPPGPATNEP